MQWPDAVALTVTYLRSGLATYSTSTYPALAGFKVAAKVPANRPLPLVVVSRVGGARDGSGLFDQPRLLVESWAETSEKAAKNVDLIRDLFHQMPGVHSGFNVSGVTEVGGPANIPDPSSGTPRYLLTVSFRVRGNARP